MLRSLRLVALFLLVQVAACTDPVVPEYQFETGFLIIEGRMTDRPGTSRVEVRRNAELFGDYTLVPLIDARVSSIDDRGEVVQWALAADEKSYVPPADFVVLPDRTYALSVETLEGELIESEHQALPDRVPLTNLRWQFAQEAYYSEERDRFVPAFTFLVDVDDPAGAGNYYQFRYRTWEMIDVCASCEQSRYRDGECIASPDTRYVTRWDYLCDVPCWIANLGVGRNVFSDNLSDGQLIEGIAAARLDYERPGGLLIEVEQATISGAACEYGQIVENLAKNAGGLNAPLPAPLVGNLRDLSELRTDVLGFVSVEAVTSERLYLDRQSVDGQAISGGQEIFLEPAVPFPPSAPCTGRNRTPERPTGWLD